MSRTLTLVATPLGNLGDLSPRAVEALTAATAWLVEDSRVSSKLQMHLAIKRPMLRLDEHTTDKAIKEYLARDATFALLTDAGTPGISDPGARMVDLAYEEGYEVDSIPGPSAVTDALSLSGFYAQRFAFFGFLPRTSGDIRKELAPYAESTFTLVLFESPFRVDKLIVECLNVLGERRVAFCRELTKKHQQVKRSTLSSIPSESEMPRKGEFTIVIEGRRKSKNSPV